MLDERAGEILNAAIQGFIDTREPVSSGWLYERYDFGIKPAMIRLELDALERGGYLEQPYHSAGRVPTDAGYALFVERILAAGATAMRESALRNFFARAAWGDLIERLASELGALGVLADLSRNTVYKAGLDELVDRLDWTNRAEISSVIRDFEEIDERAHRAAKQIGPGPKVFIGRKSPVTRSENLAVVGGTYQIGNAMVSLFAIGPKRMDYRKAIRIFKNF